MRFAKGIVAAFVALALAVAVLPPLAGQEPVPADSARDQMFSGFITAIAENFITVARTSPEQVKSFIVTRETSFEGPKPGVDSRVTIRYRITEHGDEAIRIIVRSPAINPQ